MSIVSWMVGTADGFLADAAESQFGAVASNTGTIVLLMVTLSLIGEARNADELAFVVGHEASHHILGHINRKSSAATMGAVILGGLASAYGGSNESIQTAQDFGAQFGARFYSKDWELEADYLGAIIALNAGYDPEHGAQFFARIPDPGDKILGSHPSNAARMAQVARAVADYRAGRVR